MMNQVQKKNENETRPKCKRVRFIELKRKKSRGSQLSSDSIFIKNGQELMEIHQKDKEMFNKRERERNAIDDRFIMKILI